jgi:hypothetical protein
VFDKNSEVALDTLDLSELILQFKLMRAMGYKSLFDPGFRKELKNPFRKHLYYKIMITEEALDKKNLYDYINSAVDKLSFFADPELYRKVQEEEKKRAVADGVDIDEEDRKKHELRMKKHDKLVDPELDKKTIEVLKNLSNNSERR